MHTIRLFLIDEAQTERLAELMADHQKPNACYYLVGDLGAGKTSYVRAFLKRCGVKDKIKSPTFSIIESYSVGESVFHHLDCYRITDEEEVACLGLRDLDDDNAVWLIEWPEKAGATLPEPTTVMAFGHYATGRIVEISSTSPLNYIDPDIFGS